MPLDVILYKMMICVSSLDAHSVLCRFQTHDVFLLDQFCTGRAVIKTTSHVCCEACQLQALICLYSSMCEEQRTLITVIYGQ